MFISIKIALLPFHLLLNVHFHKDSKEDILGVIQIILFEQSKYQCKMRLFPQYHIEKLVQ